MSKRILISIILMFNTIASFGQERGLLIDNKEKIYIYPDRNEYASGELVWFKIHCLNSKSNLPSDFSRIVYVDIINPHGYSILREKILLHNGLGDGSISLPDTLSTGYYSILAYTNWMKNYEYKDFSVTKILVYNPEKMELNAINEPENNNEIRFSFEGNNLVNNLKCKLFLYNPNIISNSRVSILEDTDTIATVYFKNNIESVKLIPIYNKNYYLYIPGNKQLAKIELPKVENEGLVVNLDSIVEDKYVFTIQSTDLFRSLVTSCSLFSEISQSKIIDISLIGNRQTFSVPIGLLQNGENPVSLRTQNGTVLWKRVIINSSKNKEELIITGLKESYPRRAKVQIGIKNTSNNLESNLCVSVKKTPPSENFFYSTTDSKVSVNKGNASIELSVLNDLNRHILFKSRSDNFNIKDSIFNLPEKKGILLSGKLIDQKDKPLKNTRVYLCFHDSLVKFEFQKTDTSGEFNFFIEPDFPNRDIVIGYNNAETNNSIVLRNNFINQFDFIEFLDTKNISEDKRIFLKQLYINYRIQNLYKQKYYASDSIEPPNKWTNFSFYDTPDQIVQFNNYIDLDSIHEYFYEVVPMVKVLKNKNAGYNFRVIDKETNAFLMGQPAFFIDGVFYENEKRFMSLDPQDCSKLEIIRSSYLIQDRMFAGLFSVFTLTGKLENIDLPENSTRIEFPEYNVPEMFVFNNTINSKIPDFRNTLFWNPNININSSDVAEIEFFTGDENTWYQIHVCGITNTGKLIDEKRIFKVDL